MAQKTKIRIKPSKRGTFTAAATKRGKSVQAFASQVLANKENYSPAMVKKANFARNAAKWNADGGDINMYPNGGKNNVSKNPNEITGYERDKWTGNIRPQYGAGYGLGDTTGMFSGLPQGTYGQTLPEGIVPTRGFTTPWLDSMSSAGVQMGNINPSVTPNIGHAETAPAKTAPVGGVAINNIPTRSPINVPSRLKSRSALLETGSAGLLDVTPETSTGLAATERIQGEVGQRRGFDESMLRYAPALGAGISALFPSKPEVESYGRLGQVGRLTPQQVDEARLQSQIASQYGRTKGDIAGMAGGSAAAARAGILGAGLGAAKARGQSYANLAVQNAQRRMQAEQFGLQTDLGVAQANQQIAMREAIANAQNRAAARSARRQDLTGLVGSVGGIGTEAWRAKQIGLGTGYYTNPATGEITKNPNMQAEGGPTKKPSLKDLLNLIE